MTHILARDRVCGPCEPTPGRLASCPRSGRRPAIQHSELPLSRYEDKRETDISIALSSIVFGGGALQQPFCDKLRGGRRDSGNGGAQLFLPSKRIQAALKQRAKMKKEAASVAGEFGTSPDSQPPRRKRRSRDRRPRKRGDGQRSKGEASQILTLDVVQRSKLVAVHGCWKAC